MRDIKELSTFFNNVHWKGNDSFQCSCPVHADKTPSLTVTRETNRILLHCHANCKTDNILNAVGLSWSDVGQTKEYSFKSRLEWYIQNAAEHYENNKKLIGYGTGAHIAAIYNYKDENNKYLYSKIRFEGGSIKSKLIRYYYINYINDTAESRKPEGIKTLYNLSNVIKAVKEGYPIYYVEGEKDVETLRKKGYTATTAGSADDWSDSFGQYFTGARVIILYDNDEAGEKCLNKVIKGLKPYAHSIKWTKTSAADHGDVTDFFNEGHTIEDLKDLIKNADGSLAEWIYTVGKGDNITLKVNEDTLSRNIQKNLDYLIVRNPYDDKDDIYLYKNGVYQKANKGMMKAHIRRYIPKGLCKNSLLDNIYNLIICNEDKTCSYKDLDTDENYINFRNGLYDVTSKKLLPHSPKVYSTIQLQSDYLPKEKNKPTFDKFMNDFCTDTDSESDFIDESKKAVLQEITGLLLSNDKVWRTKKCFLLVSLLGNTGKTQFLNLINELLGGDKSINVPIQNMNENSRFSLGSIVGSRLVLVGDQTSSEIEDSSVLKQITGGDPIKVERKGKQPFNYVFNGGVILACNNLPIILDDKGGHLFERLLTIPCTHTIEAEKRDSMILDKMLNEKAAIINWALEGYHRLKDNGYKFSYCKAVEDMSNKYHAQNDTIFRYIGECFIVTKDKMDIVKKTDFESGYLEYCKDNGYKSVEKKNIRERMEKIGHPCYKGNFEGQRGIPLYRFLKLKEFQESEEGQQLFEG